MKEVVRWNIEEEEGHEHSPAMFEKSCAILCFFVSSGIGFDRPHYGQQKT
jgi:hypothetical protein